LQFVPAPQGFVATRYRALVEPASGALGSGDQKRPRAQLLLIELPPEEKRMGTVVLLLAGLGMMLFIVLHGSRK